MNLKEKIKLWFDTKIIEEQIKILKKEKSNLYNTIDERQNYLKNLEIDIKEKKVLFGNVKTDWEKTHEEIKVFLEEIYDKNEITKPVMYENKLLGLRLSVWGVLIMGAFILAYAWYTNMLNLILPLEWQHIVQTTLNATNETLNNNLSNSISLNGVNK